MSMTLSVGVMRNAQTDGQFGRTFGMNEDTVTFWCWSVTDDGVQCPPAHRRRHRRRYHTPRTGSPSCAVSPEEIFIEEELQGTYSGYSWFPINARETEKRDERVSMEEASLYF